MKLVLEWVKKQGGLAAVEKVNIAKKDFTIRRHRYSGRLL